MLPDYEDNQDSVFLLKLQEFLATYRWALVVLLSGFFLLGLGMFFWIGGFSKDEGAIEVLDTQIAGESAGNGQLVVEISGAVVTPGVYTLPFDSRIDDLIKASGGITVDADAEWMGKTLNRAAKLTDGQKIYIPKVNEQIKALSANSPSGEDTSRTIISEAQNGLTNINVATQNKLEQLPGIGPVYAQKIIEQRPYSTINELVTKDVLGKSLFEKIKDQISVY